MIDVQCAGTYPDAQPGIGQRLAGLHVHDTDIKVQIHTRLLLTDVVAVELAIDTVRTPDGLGSKEAGGVLDRVVDVPLRHALLLTAGDATTGEVGLATGSQLGSAAPGLVNIPVSGLTPGFGVIVDLRMS